LEVKTYVVTKIDLKFGLNSKKYDDLNTITNAKGRAWITASFNTGPDREITSGLVWDIPELYKKDALAISTVNTSEITVTIDDKATVQVDRNNPDLATLGAKLTALTPLTLKVTYTNQGVTVSDTAKVDIQQGVLFVNNTTMWETAPDHTPGSGPDDPTCNQTRDCSGKARGISVWKKTIGTNLRAQNVCNESYYLGGLSPNSARNQIAREYVGPLATTKSGSSSSFAIRDQYGAIGTASANDISESGGGGNYRWSSRDNWQGYFPVFYFAPADGSIRWTSSGGANEKDWLTALCLATDGYYHPTAGFH
jgi:hypothetical protein